MIKHRITNRFWTAIKPLAPHVLASGGEGLISIFMQAAGDVINEYRIPVGEEDVVEFGPDGEVHLKGPERSRPRYG